VSSGVSSRPAAVTLGPVDKNTTVHAEEAEAKESSTCPAKKRRSRPNRTQKAADGVSSKVSNQLIEVGFVFEPHSSKHRRDLRFSAVIVLGVNFGVVFAGRPLAVDLGMRFLRYRSLRDVLSCCV
jgi:hypothetical protein